MSSRFVVSFAVPIAAWVGAYVLGRDMETIATYGVPLALLVTGAFLLSGDYRSIYKVTRDKISSGKGIDAEETVAEFLNSLPLNYFVIHSYDSGRGDVDHVVLCPKGVITVETKSYTGSVQANGGCLMRNNRLFEPDPIRQALSEAVLVQEALEAGGVYDLKPDPVIVFPKARVRVRERVGGVAVVSLSYFPKYLDALPDRISAATALKAYYALIRKDPQSGAAHDRNRGLHARSAGRQTIA